MRRSAFSTLVALGALFVGGLLASGQAGIYGVIERVAFEPATGAPERIQIWGAFSFVEHIPDQGFTNYASAAKRGYLYFKLPADQKDIDNTRREWADLKSVAGTRQAVAFAYWDRVRGDRLMRIREDGAKPDDPDVYRPQIGVTKLPATGAHAEIVANLKRLLDSRH